MPTELVTQLINVLGGSLMLALFFSTVWQIWRHRRADGPLRRGVVVSSETLEPSVAQVLSTLDGTDVAPWGWTRREDDVLLVFVDPYYTGDGDPRVETPWPYVAEVRFGADEAIVRYRTPPLPMLLLGVPLLVVLVPVINHHVLVGRLKARLARLAQS